MKHLCRAPNVWDCPTTIGTWATSIPPNLKVLRLIEEGRETPEKMTALLEGMIQEKLDAYDGIREAYDSHVPVMGRSYSVLEAGPKDPLREVEETHFAVQAAFYVLANIERLRNPQLLAQWISRKKANSYETACFDVWLIDCYFRQADSGKVSTFAERHTALTKDCKLSRPYKKMSRWNAAWDIHHPLIMARRVNTKDIRTIDVLEIPLQDLDPKQAFFVINNFLEFAKAGKPQ